MYNLIYVNVQSSKHKTFENELIGMNSPLFQWLNLCFDLVSLVGDTWKGQTFKSIESICISANCKLRRMFTMKSQPPDTTEDDGKANKISTYESSPSSLDIIK